MKYLVTGGAGYIGSHTVYELIENNNNQVVILDNFYTGHKHLIHPQAIFYQGDIHDEKIYDKIFQEHPDIEVIIHFAAYIVVSESVEKPLEYYWNNSFGVLALLKAMEKYNKKYIIFSSSAATYGNKDIAFIKENEPFAPINPYGASKLFSERMIYDFAKTYNVQYGILRYFNVAGSGFNQRIGLMPDKEGHFTHLIPSIVNFYLKNQNQFNVFGFDYDTKDGTCIRDYTHVEDLARAHVEVAKYLLITNKSLTVNVGSGIGYSVLEVVNALEDLTKSKLNYTKHDRRPGDPARLVADVNKISTIINFKTKKTIKDMIESEIIWRKKINQGNY